MPRLPESVRRNLRELIEHFLLPGLAVLLPWRLYFRLLKRACRSARLLPAEVEAAAQGFTQVGGRRPDAAWLARFRLTVMVDRADGFLSRTRGSGWMDRYVTRRGEWPAAPFIGITFHFGGGMWSLHDLARRGIRSAFLSLPLPPEAFGGRRIPYRASRYRLSEVGRASGAPVIYTGGSLPRIRAAIAEGISPIGLIDVPPYQTRGLCPVTLLGRAAAFPSGLVELAEREEIPVVAFVMSCDWDSGQRQLEILPVPAGTVAERVGFLASLLDDAIAAKPEAWHLWLCAPTFFRTISADQAP